jgi:hypothetical protein
MFDPYKVTNNNPQLNVKEEEGKSFPVYIKGHMGGGEV